MAELVFRNVVKQYGSVTVVDDFNLTIHDKEFLVLVGPSGCGKTTTLRMIAGLEDVTAGEMYIDDRLVNDVEPKDRDIAMVFQNYALYPHMSVYENMAFGLKLRKFAAGRDRPPRARGRGDPAHRAPARPQAQGALRRPAAARRARPRDRARAAGLPDGRAAVEPRRQAARADARRDREAAPSAGGDRRLRHARPDRGDDDGRPDRGHEGRLRPAGRHAAEALQRAGEPVRRQLHRLAGDELRHGARPGRGRRAAPVGTGRLRSGRAGAPRGAARARRIARSSSASGPTRSTTRRATSPRTRSGRSTSTSTSSSRWDRRATSISISTAKASSRASSRTARRG